MVALLAWAMVIGSLAVPGVLVVWLASNEGLVAVPLFIGVPPWSAVVEVAVPAVMVPVHGSWCGIGKAQRVIEVNQAPP